MAAQSTVLDLIFGSWKARILYAGLQLGIIDALKDARMSAREITDRLGLDATLGYRLLRAMASIGLLTETVGHNFVLSPAGRLLI
jgi:predicted transcriptional regulator